MSEKHLRQDADGSPYLGFFDPDTQLGFCWSGDFDQDVEVCHGGMGEPIIDRFRLPDIHRTRGADSLRRTFLAFQRECEAWTRRRAAAEEDTSEVFGFTADHREIWPGLIVFTNEMRVGKVVEGSMREHSPGWFDVEHRDGTKSMMNAERVSTTFRTYEGTLEYASGKYLLAHDWRYSGGEGVCTLCEAKRTEENGETTCPKAMELAGVHEAEMPWSEVCMHLGVAGRRMKYRITEDRTAVQLLNDDGSTFSIPILPSEAGVTIQEGVES